MELGRLVSDGAGPVDLQQYAAERATAPVTAAAEAPRRPMRQCQHTQIEVDPKDRRVVCKGCGEIVDPIAALQQLAENWSRHERALKAADQAAHLAKKRLDSLRHQERTAKGRLRRIGVQVREAERKLTLLDAELRSFTPDQPDTRRT